MNPLLGGPHKHGATSALRKTSAKIVHREYLCLLAKRTHRSRFADEEPKCLQGERGGGGGGDGTANTPSMSPVLTSLSADRLRKSGWSLYDLPSHLGGIPPMDSLPNPPHRLSSSSLPPILNNRNTGRSGETLAPTPHQSLWLFWVKHGRFETLSRASASCKPSASTAHLLSAPAPEQQQCAP